MFSIRLIAVSLAFLAFAVLAEKLPKPDRVPAPATPEQLALIREGVALHDQRDYEGAIAKYKQVLAENPWEVNALHELAFSYLEGKRYQQALETARLGAQCRSNALPYFHMMMGSALDELGKSKEAVDIYKAAIKLNPKVALLHFNLGVSLRRMGKQADAKAALEKGLYCNPLHPGSHFVLGAVYSDMGYRVPAIMAFSRFLALEPESPRAVQVLPVLQNLIAQGVSKNSNTNVININVAVPSKSHKDEGDFGAVEMSLGIVLAADFIDKPEELKGKPDSPYQRLIALYTVMSESLKNSNPKGGFAANFYAPYFAALAEAGHAEALVAESWKAGKVEGADEWTKANPEKIEAFRSWSQAYQWPAK